MDQISRKAHQETGGPFNVLFIVIYKNGVFLHPQRLLSPVGRVTEPMQKAIKTNIRPKLKNATTLPI